MEEGGLDERDEVAVEEGEADEVGEVGVEDGVELVLVLVLA